MVNQNASVAGVFTTNELDANSARIDALEAGVAQLESVKATTAEFANATVSGTLYAKTIADLDKQIASLLEQPSLMSVITGSILHHRQTIRVCSKRLATLPVQPAKLHSSINPLQTST